MLAAKELIGAGYNPAMLNLADLASGTTPKATSNPFRKNSINNKLRIAMERTITVTGRGAIHVVPDVNNINYSHEDVHIYSQARNIHSTAEDLAISDDVKVEWVLVAKPHNS